MIRTDALTTAYAKIASMALALSQARAFVKHDADRASVTVGFQEFAQGVLARIDEALDGTIHSLRPANDRESVECAQILAGEISRFIDPTYESDPT